MLDRPNVGVVLAATARFFSSVKWTDEKVCRIFASRPVDWHAMHLSNKYKYM